MDKLRKSRCIFRWYTSICPLPIFIGKWNTNAQFFADVTGTFPKWIILIPILVIDPFHDGIRQSLRRILDILSTYVLIRVRESQMMTAKIHPVYS